MAVPAYHRTRRGRMFRVQRASERRGTGGHLYALRAFPVTAAAGNGQPPNPIEVKLEASADDLRDRIERRQQIATPEQIFEQLWQQLRVELEAN